MLSRTLIVSLLAILCLQLAVADRLNTRIASPFIAARGQFPYIALISYDYPTANGTINTQQSTAIIYSPTTVITTASAFNNFPAAGADLKIAVGAADITQALQVITIPAANKTTYALVANGTVPPPKPTAAIIVPTTFQAGSSIGDIAVVNIPTATPIVFNAAEVKSANFPTSSPIPSENLYAVAYGNQNPGGPVFPQLKFAQVFLKRNNKCLTNLTGAGVPQTFNFSNSFCVQSKLPAQTNGTFQGICRLDVGGAIVRDGDITNPNDYYEVVGLISWAGDTTTCNSAAPVPAIVNYLWVYINNFITPLAGSPEANNNGRNATLNPNSAKGNFVCGNGIIDSSYEKCEGNSNPCCNPNTCAWRPAGYYCGTRPKPTGRNPNKCQTKPICDGADNCSVRNKTHPRRCSGPNTKCDSGVCVKCTNGACTPV